MGIIYLTINKVNGKKYIGVDSKNNPNYLGSGKLIKLAIKKYGKSNFDKLILEENNNIEYLFEKEKYWINLYNAVKSMEFYNLSNGGKGGSGTLDNEESKKTHYLKCKVNLNKINNFRKGKSYEEIYGEERAIIEKKKRSNKKIIFTKERSEKISKSLKGNIPWNKGKTFKKYILKTPSGLIIELIGKKSFEKYIKKINNNLPIKNRINSQKLVKYKKEKGYILEIYPFSEIKRLA